MKILLQRQFFGFGDWLMMASAIKQINVSRPDIDVSVDVSSIPVSRSIDAEVMTDFDIRATVCRNRPYLPDYTYVVPHVSYPRRSDRHLIAEMVNHIAEQCPGIGPIGYDDSIRAVYTSHGADAVMQTINPGYVLMPSQGILRTSGHKEWGGFEELARTLRYQHGEHIAQVAVDGDRPLRWATHQFYQLDLSRLVSLVRESKYVISLENGLSHLAGHLRHPCYTLYRHSATAPCHTTYDKQVAITDEVLTADTVASRIKGVR